MTPTMWSNDITGERLDADELARLRAKAHVLYEANVHIFEDELDALAVRAVPVVEHAASRATLPRAIAMRPGLGRRRPGLAGPGFSRASS